MACADFGGDFPSPLKALRGPLLALPQEVTEVDCFVFEESKCPIKRSVREMVLLSPSPPACTLVTIRIPTVWQVGYPRRSSVFLQFGIGWGARASLSARPDQNSCAQRKGSILADRPALPIPTRPRRIRWARCKNSSLQPGRKCNDIHIPTNWQEHYPRRGSVFLQPCTLAHTQPPTCLALPDAAKKLSGEIIKTKMVQDCREKIEKQVRSLSETFWLDEGWAVRGYNLLQGTLFFL